MLNDLTMSIKMYNFALSITDLVVNHLNSMYMLLLLIFNDKYSITYWLSVSYLIYSYFYVIIRVLLIGVYSMLLTLKYAIIIHF